MSNEKIELREKSTVLRQELKAWESSFATANNGRRADRADIKADPGIAAKYKEYNRLRDVLSGKIPNEKKPPKSHKRKAVEELPESPPKKQTPLSMTPRKEYSHADAERDTPTVSRRLFTPSNARFLGPTPQKDGVPLGLFDLLPEETPSRSERKVLGGLALNVLQTPSRRLDNGDIPDSCEKHSRTPMSTSRRKFLDTFATPLKKCDGDSHFTPLSKHHSTPAFLRRYTQELDSAVEDTQQPVIAQPWKRRTFGRSLSGMIKEMKEQEDKRIDDELDVLRELEQEQGWGFSRPNDPKPAVVEEDSQVVMKLGPDGANEESEDEDGTNRPQRTWKKKGQKRQTRKVNMRPVRSKPKAQDQFIPEVDPKFDDADKAELSITVPETQHGVTDIETLLHVSEPSDTENFSYSTPPTSPPPEEAPKSRKPIALAKDPPTKKSIKKNTNPDKHANYRRLNIKNQNLKGKGRFGGRFGRGRR
ncbi:hypothetical protein M501DRAFT_999434 [Patellaria atrata CBS 101060]|uniref:DNA replication regulator SLD2 n=1 Tax=Patellaria atrata CBS 101060 TaxID=1346257 RepID=A0A9P4VP62_9PEZI|nr:hypothetical protein M501DRAFT_999434 [Patellaria atrata CBS 101060]